MRLIGNKTRLLGDIERELRRRGIEKGSFLDVFSGTGSVARHFKSLGFRVLANDHLPACHAQAVAAVEVNRPPALETFSSKYAALFRSRRFRDTFTTQATFEFTEGRRHRQPVADSEEYLPLRRAIHLLNRHVEPTEGLIFRNYCPGGPRGGRYFTDSNAARIDGMLRFLREHYQKGLLNRQELYLLLASLLDAADRVANISGTYGAYLKSWQRNALQPLHLEVPVVVESRQKNRAFREDANELVRRVPVDVLYVDPPYTDRQYAANYHILNILAEYHEVEDLEAYETAIYGKTGLRPYDELKSLYCLRPGPRTRDGNVLSAMTDLILSSKARHVLISYNEEGLLSRAELGTILSRFSGTRTYDFRRNMRRVLYQRFCSDSNRESGDERGKRQYRVLRGKGRNQIHEWLLFASRAGTPRTTRKRGRRSLQETP